MSKAKTDWRVTKDGLSFPGSYNMNMGCHHKRRGATGGCGGCFARLYQLVLLIEGGTEPVSTIKEVRAVMRAEAEALKTRRRR